MAQAEYVSVQPRPRPITVNDRILALLDIIMHPVEMILEPLQRSVGTQRMAYFFVLPNMLIFGIFIMLPMLLNFYYAFTGGTNLFPQDRPFVSTANLQMLFQCGNFLDPNTCRADLFWRAIFNTTFYVVFQVGGMVILSLTTALALNRQLKGRGFFRGVFFYPVLLSPVVVGLIWKWILQDDGLLNAIIVALGGKHIGFLVNADWARLWTIVVSIWAQMGFYSLILLAGLQSIPRELYEAGQIDGTSDWQSFRFITLPLLMPTMLVVLVLSLIRAVQTFDQVFVLTGGGPGTATNYVVQYIYSIGFGSAQNQYGLAAAASLVIAVVLMVLTLGQLYLGRSNNNQST